MLTSHNSIVQSNDENGTLELFPDRVVRHVNADFYPISKGILDLCNKTHFLGERLIETWVSKDTSHTFEHEKIPTVSYPFEWPTSMFNDAVKFHFDLFNILESKSLTLKDWHLGNVLFKATKPIFVDFLSVIPQEYIINQKYLGRPYHPKPISYFWDKYSLYWYEMYRRMYLPGILIPTYLRRQRKFDQARAAIENHHTSMFRWNPKIEDVYRPRSKPWWKFRAITFLKQLSLIEGGTNKKRFRNLIEKEFFQIETSVPPSGYLTYYKNKSAVVDFYPNSTWSAKHRTIHSQLLKHSPRSVLDIGANTGWFSILASRMGAKVVAIDLDESCIDHLYNQAKSDQLNILPLVADFLKESIYLNSKSVSVTRLQGDFVLCLGLIHHLTLGAGKSLSDILKKLRNLTTRIMVLEFVQLTDPLVQSNTDFFPTFKKFPGQFNEYNLENAIFLLQKSFTKVEVLQGESKFRPLLICTV